MTDLSVTTEKSIYPEFDLVHSRLDGRNLIEASAGTGKTYTISRVFVRLLLEKNYSVNKILVVTFTEAATQELKERIFLVLRETLLSFERGFSEDPFYQSLIKKLDREHAIQLLKSALRAFDTVSIFTIHGFCQRLLSVHAFECGHTFDSEIITDQSDLLREIAEDFWRIHFYTATPSFISYALSIIKEPYAFLSLINKSVLVTQPKILPETTNVDSSVIERSFANLFQEVKTCWQNCREEIVKSLQSPALKATSYKPELVAKRVIEIDSFLQMDLATPLLFKDFDKFTSTFIVKNTKTNQTPPSHTFFDLCNELLEKAQELQLLFEKKVLYLKAEFIRYASTELSSRKQQRNVLYFDDLLTKVHLALKNDHAGQFTKILGEEFKAALIDEFQDTDPVQYEIFSAIFPKGSTLFLIGDPKQAIYSFRGADIFAYLQATDNVDFQYTLRTNFRSDKDLVRAVNAVFKSNTNPFIFRKITFGEVHAGKQDDSQQLKVNGIAEQPFHFWYLNEDVNREKATNLIVKSVTSEIVQLILLGSTLSGLIGKKPVAPSDIAILVRTNKEARTIKEALASVHVPSVLDTNESVFCTNEASELITLLGSIAEPHRPDLLKAALTTSFFCYDAHRINQLASNEQEWDDLISRFCSYHDQWVDRGFMTMIRSFMNKEKIRARLLGLEFGERRLTNILHICELLHSQERSSGSSLASTTKWLTEKVLEELPQVAEEHTIRLESDDDAVKIVTIHKCKGLEYPIVFCPFTWAGSENSKKNPYLFHDSENHFKQTLVLGGDEYSQYNDSYELETLAENCRLLYVALTRAKSRCYLVWGAIKGSESSAPSYIINGDSVPELKVSALGDHVKSLNSDDQASRINQITQNKNIFSSTFISSESSVEPIPTTSKKKPIDLSAREWVSAIPQPWTVQSFTSLTRSRLVSESPDYDFSFKQKKTEPKDSDKTILDFPGGAEAGVFFHDLLEHFDYSNNDPVYIANLAQTKLTEYGYDSKWSPIIEKLCLQVTTSKLSIDENLSLSIVAQNETKRELEFYFPLRPTSPPAINKIFSESSQQVELFSSTTEYSASGLTFSPSFGFMKGYVDLFFRYKDRFFLIDWKSNFLGEKQDDYSEQSLRQAMQHEHYILQYHLYLVALNKFLKLRIPEYSYEENFGGIFYVFLRGLNNQNPGSGIFSDRPSSSLIAKLSSALIQD